ncbi:MAG: diguanylate cyclase [Lachnospiraceae bacterium]|nr:diguanylate cyclase [Lachnospiraceae bacterium]
MEKAKKDFDAETLEKTDKKTTVFEKMNNSIKYNPIYHRLIYVASIITALIVYLAKITNSSKNPKINALQVFVVLTIFFVIDILLFYIDYFMSPKVFLVFRTIEIVFFEAITAIIPNLMIIMVSLFVLLTIFMIEYMVYDTDFARDAMISRIITIAVIMLAAIAFGMRYRSETETICYVLIQLTVLFSVFAIVDLLVEANQKYHKEIFELTIENSDIQEANDKLIEYQEKIETINEQINYQKIEMKRTNKELAQVNKEIEAQTKVLSFMISTFDIPKCMDVLADSIVETKNAKLCAVYMEPDDYISKRGNLIIKTNYSAVERKLRKEIESIFTEFKSGKNENQILIGEELKKFRFIGDSNLKSIALFPFADGKKVYGLILVASDRLDFFDKGLGFYEASAAEFNLSVKNTRLYLMMQDMAHKDGLTGINNRMYFMQLFDSAIKRAKRKKANISVAMYDIDKFKSVNDNYGHLAGDAVIKTVAGIGNRYAEENGGFAGRYGGEEFLMVLPDKSVEESLPILEEMHKEIKNTIVRYEQDDISVNVCIGLTSYPDVCEDTNLLINRADMAMYYGKEHGRGRLVVDDMELIKE